jgi:VanZ family protein
MNPINTSNPINMLNYKYAPLATLCAVLIVYISSLPDHSLSGNGSLSEQIVSNLAHIPAYALLTFLWLKTFEKIRIGGLFSGKNALILIGPILFAISDEVHQSFVPGRSASFMDVGLDLLGIFFGFGIFRIFEMLGTFHKSLTDLPASPEPSRWRAGPSENSKL